MSKLAKHDLVFLFGAGASVPAKLPTAVGLTKKVEDSIVASYPSLLPALRFVEGAIQFGKTCRGEALSEKVNIEDLLAACLFLSHRPQSYVYPFVSSWHEKISDFHPLPQDLNIDEYDNTYEFLSAYCKSELKTWLKLEEQHDAKHFRSLLDFVNDGFKLRVFTLNYDECVEVALSGVMGSVNDRWTTGFSETGWTPALLSDDDKDVYIYKLHGSLDWIDDEMLGICSLSWPMASEAETIAEAYDPLLIFGAQNKMQATDPFLTLFYHFQNHLNTEEIVVIVGYSFGDDHINRMIIQALQRFPSKRLIVVDYATDARSILPEDFQKYVAVEERISFIDGKRGDAKFALENNVILKKVKELRATVGDERPF